MEYRTIEKMLNENTSKEPWQKTLRTVESPRSDEKLEKLIRLTNKYSGNVNCNNIE